MLWQRSTKGAVAEQYKGASGTGRRPACRHAFSSPAGAAKKTSSLLCEMLASFSYPDRGIVADMAAGFRITGDLGVAGIFDLKAEDDLKDPVDVNWLWQNAREIR